MQLLCCYQYTYRSGCCKMQSLLLYVFCQFVHTVVPNIYNGFQEFCFIKLIVAFIKLYSGET